MSAFYLGHPEDKSRTKYDFVEDYDYDYFQREPHCKTTSSIGANFGGESHYTHDKITLASYINKIKNLDL